MCVYHFWLEGSGSGNGEACPEPIPPRGAAHRPADGRLAEHHPDRAPQRSGGRNGKRESGRKNRHRPQHEADGHPDRRHLPRDRADSGNGGNIVICIGEFAYPPQTKIRKRGNKSDRNACV